MCAAFVQIDVVVVIVKQLLLYCGELKLACDTRSVRESLKVGRRCKNILVNT